MANSEKVISLKALVKLLDPKHDDPVPTYIFGGGKKIFTDRKK